MTLEEERRRYYSLEQVEIDELRLRLEQTLINNRILQSQLKDTRHELEELRYFIANRGIK